MERLYSYIKRLRRLIISKAKSDALSKAAGQIIGISSSLLEDYGTKGPVAKRLEQIRLLARTLIGNVKPDEALDKVESMETEIRQIGKTLKLEFAKIET